MLHVNGWIPGIEMIVFCWFFCHPSIYLQHADGAVKGGPIFLNIFFMSGICYDRGHHLDTGVRVWLFYGLAVLKIKHWSDTWHQSKTIKLIYNTNISTRELSHWLYNSKKISTIIYHCSHSFVVVWIGEKLDRS